ncbi:MAG: HD domain-containing protein [Chloroflexi bacterium]|nr:HD domain-containing protein [Chloroflexota bacterium]
MKIPTLEEAKFFLAEAEDLNPGAWVKHTMFVAEAASAIANYHPGLDPTMALILGYLHDIGRREGVTQNRHIIDGYRFLQDKDFDDAARICFSHSFPVQDISAIPGKWDCSNKEFEFVKEYLSQIEYTVYDRLLQLCDALALDSGFCLIEKRLVDVAIRYGTDKYTIPRWQAYLNIRMDFERVIERSIYSVLPGVVENTFGFATRMKIDE